MAVNVVVCVQLFALFSLLSVSVKASDNSHGSLVLAQVLFRHGDRSPCHFFQNDEHKDYWPQGRGQLTPIGMRQQYHLGQFLRHRYTTEHSLLNGTYINSQVHVRSTDVDRTLMSAYSNLAGLFPPSGSQEWDDKIPWQPIPVHTVPKSEDKLLNGANCPTVTKLCETILNSHMVQELEHKEKRFFDYLSKYIGDDVKHITDVGASADTLYCELSHNISLPDWAQNIWDNTVTVYEKLRTMSEYSFYLTLNYDPTLSRLRGGPLLKQMIHNMNTIIDGGNPMDSRAKLFIYSAHDSNVAPLLGALKVYNRLFPPYASAVLVELYNASGSYSVQLHYRNDSSKEPIPLQIPGCTVICPYDKFLSLTSDMIPIDWDAECQRSLHIDRESLMLSLGAASAVMLLILVVISIVLIIMYVRRRHHGNRGYRGVPYEVDE